jgi:outer membrane protein OmpA-like peptidoglycan-associated protein
MRTINGTAPALRGGASTETIMNWTGRAVLFAFLLIGCASSPPPRQLLDARAAYNQARMGKASQYTPADLHTAKVALNAAEQAFEDDPESPETFALSYVALRTSQLVESKANTKAAEADADRAETDYQKLQEGELARARSELGVKSQQLASTSEQLAKAEDRYKEAMRKLAEAAALNVKEDTRGTVIVLPGSVLFDTGKSTLTAVAQQKLTLVAGTIAPQAEEHDIVVEGHTDSRGSRDFNMSLSQQRAQTVMNFLVSRGVPAESITAVGIGPDRPMTDNNTRDGRAENRRVEIVIKPSEKR